MPQSAFGLDYSSVRLSSKTSCMAIAVESPAKSTAEEPGRPRAVLCGSYRRDVAGLQNAYRLLLSSDCDLLSPASIAFVGEVDGFVLTAEELEHSPAEIEAKHVEAIREADFVWLHDPDGYVGSSAALEVGIAHSLDIPVYAGVEPADVTMAEFVTVVSKPAAAVALARRRGARTPSTPLRDLQRYYARVAAERGFDGESARDTMLLLVEEIGELARSVRLSVGLARADAKETNPAEELADVQLYVLHLSNAMGIDLAHAVHAKEQVNHIRYGKLAA